MDGAREGRRRCETCPKFLFRSFQEHPSKSSIPSPAIPPKQHNLPKPNKRSLIIFRMIAEFKVEKMRYLDSFDRDFKEFIHDLETLMIDSS
ncbi:hypothetical protein AVEN_152838-1 [Araneus ventricosus]|uniref:Uncharacterized protein n=1 Tax=Araneus ventricosus TaxID=182803 RepID=A0A4Y2TRA0_ARAVE|nr:hypothetical protein AVEN_152838-1 [Araneus ventricosus]